jgi:carbon monoxide dehydrogenase subunit G
MLINSSFEVAQSADKVWTFFENIPQVAACLPGANLTDDLGDDTYGGTVGVSMGPVKMQFAGKAQIKDKNEAARTLVVDASGADEKGRGQAQMKVDVKLVPLGGGTRVDLAQDLQLSGAAAQYGRGMIADVTAIIMRDFATNMQNRIVAIEQGIDPDSVAGAKSASGLAIGMRAARMALTRVFRRFFLPYTAPAA